VFRLRLLLLFFKQLGGYFVIDNWSYGGSTVVTENHVRITPDRQRKSGWLWSKQVCVLVVH
jgi:Legume-like lectin family